MSTHFDDGHLRQEDPQYPEDQKPEEPQAEYAIIELMGHVRHVGRVTEVERFGTKLGRVDVPKGGKFELGYTTVFFSGAALYRMTPCDLATVTKANQPYEAAGRLTYREDMEDDDDAADLEG